MMFRWSDGVEFCIEECDQKNQVTAFRSQSEETPDCGLASMCLGSLFQYTCKQPVPTTTHYISVLSCLYLFFFRYMI